jgi:hypothetical protein
VKNATTLKQNFRTFPYHIVGVVLFFITHGYSENIGLIPLKDIILCFLSITTAALLCFFILFRIQRNAIKAGLLTTFLFAWILFFGAFQDILQSNSLLSELSRYRVLLPLFVISFVALFIFLKQSSKNFQKVNLFLNTVFTCVILLDLFLVAVHKRDKRVEPKSELSDCSGCRKPDIFLLVLDEYAGTASLKQTFKYDNSAFQNLLREHGFHVIPNPRSNYSATPISMASFFDMNYVRWMKDRKTVNAQDYTIASDLIGRSEALNGLKAMGYHFYNYSIFDIDQQPSQFNTGLLPFRLKLITSKTLYNRIEKDLGWQVRAYAAPKFDWLANVLQEDFRTGNKRLIDLTKNLLDDQKHAPKFVYTHLMMPHAPYLYDSVGQKSAMNSYATGSAEKQSLDGYLQYLVYTNSVVSELVGEIMQKTRGNSIVIVMSDHGLRVLPGGFNNNNFTAVYLPSKSYDMLYDSLSNVNLFRIVFNTEFNQHLSLLKDSIAF